MTSIPLILFKNISWLTSCHSTNLVLSENYNNQEIKEPFIIATHEQTAGIGQRNNKWIAEKGKNLTFSIGMPLVDFPAHKQFLLNKAISIAIWETITHYLPNQNVKIKWPNDILVNGQKICGILIDNKLRGNIIHFSIIGIGMNINQLDFGYLNATSLKKIESKEFDIQEILLNLIEKINLNFEHISNKNGDEINLKYLNNLYKINEMHSFKTIEGEPLEAIIIDVDENGLLVLDHQGISKKFNLKEIKF